MSACSLNCYAVALKNPRSTRWKLGSPLLAQSGHFHMSHLMSLSGAKRT
jgi:hypothetical protein